MSLSLLHLLVSKDPTVRCTPNSWGMPSRSVGVNAEGTQFDKQRKAMEMLANGDFFLCYLGLVEG